MTRRSRVCCTAICTPITCSAPTTAGGALLSKAAQPCFNSGWQNLITSAGASFTSQQGCVGYVVGGGTLLPAAAQPCFSNGWQGYTTAGGRPFTSEQDCVDYVVGGGALTVIPPAVTTPAVYLGYADNSHVTSGVLPSPWAGDAGVTFLGCTTCTLPYDAGAIRIDNPVSNPALTLTAASVDIGLCHFQPWGSFLPAIAAPGGKLVLTQTGLLGAPQPSPCNQGDPASAAYQNFDTSEGPLDSAATRSTTVIRRSASRPRSPSCSATASR